MAPRHIQKINLEQCIVLKRNYCSLAGPAGPVFAALQLSLDSLEKPERCNRCPELLLKSMFLFTFCNNERVHTDNSNADLKLNQGHTARSPSRQFCFGRLEHSQESPTVTANLNQILKKKKKKKFLSSGYSTKIRPRYINHNTYTWNRDWVKDWVRSPRIAITL